jgi:hypothetical protein
VCGGYCKSKCAGGQSDKQLKTSHLESRMSEKPLVQSCPANRLEISSNTPDKSLVSGEKKDITQTKFLGRWNSAKGCMEWEKIVGNVDEYVENFISLKNLRDNSVEGGISLPGAADFQAVHNLNLELPGERDQVNLSRKSGKTNWKKRARSQLLLRDEVNLADV